MLRINWKNNGSWFIEVPGFIWYWLWRKWRDGFRRKKKPALRVINGSRKDRGDYYGPHGSEEKLSEGDLH